MTPSSFAAKAEQNGFSHGALMPYSALDAACFLTQTQDLGGSILLLASAGPAFWRVRVDRDEPQPVDAAARRGAIDVANAMGGAYRLLYPDADCRLNLQALLQRHRWVSGPSPLGFWMSDRYGSYIAVRAVVHLSRERPAMAFGVQSQASPCIDCDAPCVAQCPGQALDRSAAPDIAACGAYRAEHNGQCADRCVARLACPAGAEYRYDWPQFIHHYSHSRWFERFAPKDSDT